MTQVTGRETVGDLVMHHPGAARVFEDLLIDYCCGGGRTLEEACVAAGTTMPLVLERLARAPRDATPAVWESRGMGELVDHIVAVHHEHDRRELVRLRTLATRVASVHGARHGEVVAVRALVDRLAAELEPHMLREERILFPYVRALEAAERARSPVAAPPFTTVQAPVRRLLAEHEAVGRLLRQLRGATRGYTLPSDACASYTELYGALADFERELHVHIHLENDVLFPRAVRTEAALPGAVR